MYLGETMERGRGLFYYKIFVNGWLKLIYELMRTYTILIIAGCR